MLAAAAAALIAGLLTVLTGIGGVIIVPALTEFAGVPIDRAVGTTMFSFLFSGFLAAYANLRRVRLSLAPVAALCVTGALGALVGTATLDWLPPALVRLFIAALAVASGAHALLYPRHASATASAPQTPALAALGLLVGYGSAISGTGGPVMLIPILLMLGTPATTAVALGLAAHLPIILTASAVNAAGGRIDYSLGAALGGLLVTGTLAGMWLFGRLSGRRLTVIVALALIAVGSWYAYATLGGSGVN